MKRILVLLLAALLALPLLSCQNNSGVNSLYNYDLNEYITVDMTKITVDRTTLKEYALEQFRTAAKADAVTKIYGGTAEGALPADGITVENGDTANIDYVGTKDGVAFEGGTAKGYDLVIGSNSFIDGFEAGLVGVKVGETKALNLKFPDSYHSADLAGKNVVFTVTVNSVKRVTYPDYNEENVKKYTGKTVAEFEASFIGTLAFDTLYQNATVKKYPEKELQLISDKYIQSYTDYANQYGMTLPAYISAMGTTVDVFYEYIDGMAKQYVKRDLLTFYIIEQYPELKITNYEKAAKEFYESIKADGSYTGSYEDFITYNDESDIIISIYSEKIIKLFDTTAKVNEPAES